MPAQGYVPVIYNGRSRLLQTFIQRLASVKTFHRANPFTLTEINLLRTLP